MIVPLLVPILWMMKSRITPGIILISVAIAVLAVVARIKLFSEKNLIECAVAHLDLIILNGAICLS